MTGEQAQQLALGLRKLILGLDYVPNTPDLVDRLNQEANQLAADMGLTEEVRIAYNKETKALDVNITVERPVEYVDVQITI